MTEHSSDFSSTDENKVSRFIYWLTLIPLGLFPILALLTYDWHAIASLQCPAAKSSNWIGALGDTFAYYGYQFIGFAIWLVPIFNIALCAREILFGTRTKKTFKQIANIAVFTISTACLFQVIQHNSHSITAALSQINTPNAGGAVGYLIMTRMLSPLLSDFGASIIVSSIAIVSLILIIGPSNILKFMKALIDWALAKNEKSSLQDSSADEMPQNLTDDDPFAKFEALSAPKKEKTQSSTFSDFASIANNFPKPEEKPSNKILSKIIPQPKQKKIEEPLADTGKTAPRKAYEQSPSKNETPDNEKKGPYMLPPVSLLNEIPDPTADYGNIPETGKRLIDTLNLFKIKAELSEVIKGPVVTRYIITPAPGTRYSLIESLKDNLMGAMRATSIRIEAPIKGQDRVGIEVPNPVASCISFREIIESDCWQKKHYELPLLFGKDAAGNDLVADLASLPHLLVAGATGQGKSVCLNSIICGLLMSKTPDELKFIMVDPKTVEFKNYEELPHLLVPIINDNAKTLKALMMAVVEMEKRLSIFSKVKAKNIKDFNSRPKFTQIDMFGEDEKDPIPDKLPYIVIIIDELADLMTTCAKEVTPHIGRLAAKARAAGINLILATQRPDTKVIQGTIKSNIPGRVAFKTASSIDSRTILDSTGAESLIGRGDMFYKNEKNNLVRAQGALISEDEIHRITSFISEHAPMQLDEKLTSKLAKVKVARLEDELDEDEDDEDSKESAQNKREAVRAAEKASNYKKAVELLINEGRISISFLQQRLSIGYNNAARICDELQKNNVLGPQPKVGSRPILMSQDELRDLFDSLSDNETESEEKSEEFIEAQSIDYEQNNVQEEEL
jgi:S-DNA-T family DNA segregation ATPase FtsK/SpoIIIE